MELSLARVSRFRRFAHDYGLLNESLARHHVLAFTFLMLVQAAPKLKSA